MSEQTNKPIGKQIFVHDAALPPAVLSGIQDYFAANVRWQFGWPQGLQDPFSHWNIDFLGTPLKSQANVEDALLAKPEWAAVADVWRALKAGPMRGHYLLRCYANAHTYGVEGHPHTDIVDSSQVDNFTAVVYLNPVWKKEWAGELTLFNSAGDTLCAVLPKPGRAALIPGDIVHAARGVSRQCPAVRVCLAFKTRLPTKEELNLEPYQGKIHAEHAGTAPDLGANKNSSSKPLWHLYIDPSTQRIAYLSAEPSLPTRIFVYEGGKQEVERVFVASQLLHHSFAGDLPERLYPQNSWAMRFADGQFQVA